MAVIASGGSGSEEKLDSWKGGEEVKRMDEDG
jgi:hypothetical protein